MSHFWGMQPGAQLVHVLTSTLRFPHQSGHPEIRRAGAASRRPMGARRAADRREAGKAPGQPPGANSPRASAVRAGRRSGRDQAAAKTGPSSSQPFGGSGLNGRDPRRSHSDNSCRSRRRSPAAGTASFFRSGQAPPCMSCPPSGSNGRPFAGPAQFAASRSPRRKSASTGPTSCGRSRIKLWPSSAKTCASAPG